MYAAVQTVIELDSDLIAAKHAGVGDDERAAIVDLIAADPTVGVSIAGGARKMRIAGRGRGKSGGYRLIYFFADADIPLFLITIFGKGEKDNLTRAEKNALADLTNALRAAYGR